MSLREITNVLQDIESLLDSCKVGYAIIAKKYVEQLKQMEASGAADEQRILFEIKKQMLAGMGSLNDVWISRENGHNVDDEDSANKVLEEYRTRLRQQLKSY